MENPFNSSNNNWDDFLHTVIGGVSQVITAVQNPPTSQGGWGAGTVPLPAPAPASNMTGLLLIAVLVLVVMKA